MAENRINYLNRDYNECKQNVLDITRKYYPDVFANIDDASIGNWLVTVISDVYDALNFHIDRVFQETNIDSASQLSSLQNIARTNGLRIPGKKSALCEIEISCQIPLSTDEGNLRLADEAYCPFIKRGMLVSDGMHTFELVNDVDFSKQFDENGMSNRQIIPTRDSNGNIVSYTYKKLAVVVAGQSKIYKQVITNSDIKPFMEVLIQDSDILGVESIIVKDGTTLNTDPQISEFFVDDESYKDNSGKYVQRYFEVDNLVDQYRFGYVMEDAPNGKYNPVWEDITADINDDSGNVGETIVSRVVKGQWKRLKNKFITEYTDDWNLKVIFGAGIRNKYGDIPENAQDFTKYMMSRMEANDCMGVLPEANKTMYILYRVGGGEQTNIAKDTLTNIIYNNMQIDGRCSKDPKQQSDDSFKKRNVKNTLKVTNTTPSYGGKDEPSAEEIKYMLKYNNSSQNRCVTLKDYYVMINKIPAKYGCPFRIGVVEENNKVVIYTLGLDYNGWLTNMLSETVAENIKEYLKMYKMINDFIEIKSGKVINIGFDLNVYIDKSYDKSEVTKRIIDTVYDYMDIKKHLMGEEIFLGDLQKEISKLDGVINLVSLKCFNKVGNGYSDDVISQEIVQEGDYCNSNDIEDKSPNNNNGVQEIDLKASDYILFSEVNSMFEIKYKEKDIFVTVKTR